MVAEHPRQRRQPLQRVYAPVAAVRPLVVVRRVHHRHRRRHPLQLATPLLVAPVRAARRAAVAYVQEEVRPHRGDVAQEHVDLPLGGGVVGATAEGGEGDSVAGLGRRGVAGVGARSQGQENGDGERGKRVWSWVQAAGGLSKIKIDARGRRLTWRIAYQGWKVTRKNGKRTPSRSSASLSLATLCSASRQRDIRGCYLRSCLRSLIESGRSRSKYFDSRLENAGHVPSSTSTTKSLMCGSSIAPMV